jgi:hypothetical protein
MPHLITLVCRQISVDNNRDEMYAGAVNASGISQLECVGLLQKHCIRNLHTKNIGMLFVSSRRRSQVCKFQLILPQRSRVQTNLKRR